MHLDERHSLPRKATTNYKAKKGKDFLTVEAIWFFAKFYAANPKAAHPAYMKEALAAKFAQISLLDRKDLLAYLTGEVDTSANIDVNIPALTDAPLVGEKRGRDDAGAAPGAAADEAPRVRTAHTRNSALQCDKDFSAVLGFFGASAVGKKGDGKVVEGVTNGDKKADAPLPDIAPLKTDRFADVDQDEFNKTQFGTSLGELGIDAFGYDPLGRDKAKESVLPQMSAMDAMTSAAAMGSSGKGAGPRASRPQQSRKRRDPSEGAVPLIIVPAGYGNKVMFNMYNIVEFLRHERLVTWDSMHKKGAKKASSHEFTRYYGRDEKVRYEVTDKAPHKKSEDWARVVAVFVSGKEWQFKDWPFKGADEGDLVETFQKVRGFYAQYDTETPADIIKTWNVHTLRFQKNVRHGDRAQFEAFWSEVDKHLKLRRSLLRY